MEEEIRRRAYELYEQRGRQEGSHAEDWIPAVIKVAASSQEGWHEEDWSRAKAEILSKYQREKSA